MILVNVRAVRVMGVCLRHTLVTEIYHIPTRAAPRSHLRLAKIAYVNGLQCLLIELFWII